MSNLFFLKTSLGKLSIHLPHLEYPSTSPLIIQSILQAFKTFLQILGRLFVCIYLFCCCWPEPKACCVSKKLETLQTVGQRFCKLKKNKNHLISPTVTPQLIILDIFCNLPLLCSYLHHLVAGINTSLMSWKSWIDIRFLHRLLLTIWNMHLWQFDEQCSVTSIGD